MRFLISRLTEPHFSKEYLATLNDPRYMRFSQHKNVQATVEILHALIERVGSHGVSSINSLEDFVLTKKKGRSFYS